MGRHRRLGRESGNALLDQQLDGEVPPVPVEQEKRPIGQGFDEKGGRQAVGRDVLCQGFEGLG